MLTKRSSGFWLCVVLLVSCGASVVMAPDGGGSAAGGGSAGGESPGGGSAGGASAGGSAGGASAGGSAGGASAGGSAGGASAGGSAGGASAGGSAGGRVDAGAPAWDGGLLAPPPLPTYSGGTCPTLVSSPFAANARNRNFRSQGDTREFLVLVPSTYTPTKRYPVVFGYHWLNASATSVVREAQLERTSLAGGLFAEGAVNQYDFIAVVPENLEGNRTCPIPWLSGQSAYCFNWPFFEAMSAPKELAFFEDMLACVGQQFSVDPARVHVFGVSAGGLWTAFLSTTPNVNRVASVMSVSGGLGQTNVGGVNWRLDFTPQQNKFPAFIVWGGMNDWFPPQVPLLPPVGINFDDASKRYRDALRQDNHFVATCMHSGGHAVPTFPAPTDGGTRFPMFWEFFRDHPYGMPANVSPYRQSGLPRSFPSTCTVVP
jgi:hypothetical protein